MLLCYPSNASDEGMIRAKKFLDCEEERQNPQYGHGETLKHPEKVVKRLNKGTKGSNSFEKDDAAKAAFNSLRQAVAEDAALHTPDFTAAADPSSGRPFELYIDAS